MKRQIIINKSKHDGVYQLMPTIVKNIEVWLSSITDGEYVLSVERLKRGRSLRQNSLMWLWFEAIAQEWSDATGKVYLKEQVKEYYCRLFLPKYTPSGDVIGGSTSGLSTDEMTVFLDNVQAHAASEFGIELPTPDMYNFELWRKQYER